METGNSNISDEKEATKQLVSNDVSNDESLNKIKNILQEGGDYYINPQKNKKIFDNFMKLFNKIFSISKLWTNYFFWSTG